MRRLIPILLVVVLVGCGEDTPTDEEQVREVLTGFASAVEARDYQRLCDEIFAEELLQGLQQIGLPCEVAMRTGLENRQDPKLTVGTITIDGDTATAEVRTSAGGEAPSSNTLTLTRSGDRWQVTALGGGSEEDPQATASPSAGPTGSPPAADDSSPTPAP